MLSHFVLYSPVSETRSFSACVTKLPLRGMVKTSLVQLSVELSQRKWWNLLLICGLSCLISTVVGFNTMLSYFILYFSRIRNQVVSARVTNYLWVGIMLRTSSVHVISRIILYNNSISTATSIVWGVFSSLRENI
jgi:hypothetical protein